MQRRGTVRVVAFQDGDQWVAQGLELDIGVQADSFEELRVRLDLAFQAERKTSMEMYGEPYKGIEPAPQYFHDMWDEGVEPVESDDGHDYELALRAA